MGLTRLPGRPADNQTRARKVAGSLGRSPSWGLAALSSVSSETPGSAHREWKSPAALDGALPLCQVRPWCCTQQPRGASTTVSSLYKWGQCVIVSNYWLSSLEENIQPHSWLCDLHMSSEEGGPVPAPTPPHPTPDSRCGLCDWCSLGL